MRLLPLLLIPAFTACKVVDAPANLEELMVFGFENFDGSERSLINMFDELVPLVDEQDGALEEGYRIDTLSTDNLEDLGIDEPDVEDIVGAMGQADYTHEMSDVLFGVTYPDKSDVFETYEQYEVLEDTDLGCFLDLDCESYDMTAAQVVQVPILGESTQDVNQLYRRLNGTDGTPFIITRVLSPEGVSFNTSIVDIPQQYQLFVLYPHDGGTRRVEAFWVEAHVIGLNVPDSVAVDNFAGSVGDQAARVDEFLDTQ